MIGLRRPQTAEVSDGHVLGTYLNNDNKEEYIYEAELWKKEEAPHLALVNIRTLDTQGDQNMRCQPGLRIDEKALVRFFN